MNRPMFFWYVMGIVIAKAKAKARDSYIVRLTGKPHQQRFIIIGSGCAAALMRLSIAHANEQLDPRQQLANTTAPINYTGSLPRKHSPDVATRADI